MFINVYDTYNAVGIILEFVIGDTFLKKLVWNFLEIF